MEKEVTLKTQGRFNILYQKTVSFRTLSGEMTLTCMDVYVDNLTLDDLVAYKSECTMAKYFLESEDYLSLKEKSDVWGITYAEILEIKGLTYGPTMPIIKAILDEAQSGEDNEGDGVL